MRAWIGQSSRRLLKGLKLGLLLEAGCGAAPTAEVKAAIERAARDFEAAGAIVEPLKPFLTQDMLDGLDRFWRAEALNDIGQLPARRRALILPFIREWAESAAGFSGVEVFRGFDQIPEMRKAAVEATAKFDFVLSPTAPMTAFPAEWASPSHDPLNPFPHIGFTVAYNMSEQPAASVNCGYRRRGAADRAADHRTPVRRPWRPGPRPYVRGDAGRRGEAVARTASGLNRAPHAVPISCRRFHR